MRQFNITKKTEGKKLLRYLSTVLPKAGTSFLYKMLRKKNITLNGAKALGSEVLKNGDIIQIFFSESTFEIFSESRNETTDTCTCQSLYDIQNRIVYEDEDIILVNKPAGILSQKAASHDFSMVEAIEKYLGENDGFKPAVANRLDRNTSGIIAAGKSVKGLKYLSDGFRTGHFTKYYLCPVTGSIKEPTLYNGLWSKNSHGNTVTIRDIGWKIKDGRTFPKEYRIKGNIPVQTAVYPVSESDDLTLLKIELLTGKSHQIRAQLSTAGHFLLGDCKYGRKEINDYFKAKYGIKFHMLHAYCLLLPEKGIFFADIPDYLEEILKGEGLWVRGIQEVFEDQSLRI